LTKAAKKVELTDMSVLSELTDRVVSEIFTRFSENVKIYEIQSIVEQELLESGETQLAEEYISYSANRDLYRTKATDINFNIEKLINRD
ncbi:ATP cone domain-containing protein, partial [Staphylococcus epidermidis]